MNESIAHKIATRNDYDKTIAETENAYKKVRTVVLSFPSLDSCSKHEIRSHLFLKGGWGGGITESCIEGRKGE